MTTETACPAILVGGPDIHVWMTPDEAAATLSMPVENVERQLDEGDLDSRVNEEGLLEVLICLPKRDEKPPRPESQTQLSLVRESIEPASIAPATLGQTMMPLIHAMRYTSTNGDEIRRGRRSGRRAWALAAALMIAAGGAIAVSSGLAVRARSVAAETTQQLNRTSAQSAMLSNDKDTLTATDQTLREANAELTARLSKLTAEQDRLKTQLSQATESLTKAQGDLVVERNVEDQLLQAALAAHATKGSPKNQVIADGSN